MMNVFEIIRDQISLPDIVRRFTELKRSGTRLAGCCPLPDHKERTPSFTVYAESYWYCFGCNKHGDVIELWANVRSIQPGIEAALDLAREYGVALPDKDPQAAKKAEERRQKESDFARQALDRHAALAQHPQVRQWWQQRGFDETLQAQFLLGSNDRGTAAIIPFWHRGRIQGLIRRQLQGEPKYLLPAAGDFPSGYKPLFIPSAITSDIHEVEGFIDALALSALGLCAIAIGGTGISEPQKDELTRLKGPRFILPDADEPGTVASRVWVNEQYPDARLCPAEYGTKQDDTDCKDPADLFQAKGEQAREIIESLKARAIDALDLALKENPNGSALARYRYGREYIVPLLLRLEDQGERSAAAEDAAKALKLKVGEFKRLLKAEVATKAQESKPTSDIPQAGSERYERAMELLKSPMLLWRVVRVMRQLGHVGEMKVKLLAFICAVSARMGRPIQPSTHAQSSAGKNALWDTVLSLFPTEMVIRRSGLSAKALFRTQVNLKGAILYIQEMAGSEAAEYTIRVMQSDGRLEYEATEKAPDGSMRNVVYSTEGPTVIVQTTTKNHLHSENETRVFPIYVDESEEQTERIVQSILNEAAGGGISNEKRQAILQVWHDVIRLLEPSSVVIPYAERIVIPTRLVRIRRDARRLLDVIKVIAWLYQRQRGKDSADRIIATEKDFKTALKLVTESLTRAWQTLTPSEQRVLESIQRIPTEKQISGFKRRDLKLQEISNSRLKEILRSLADSGYLDCDGRAGPQGFTYTMAKGVEEISVGIYLRPQSSDDKHPNINKENIPEETLSSDSVQSSNSRDEGVGYQPLDAIGQNGNRPVNIFDRQQLGTIGRLEQMNIEKPPRSELAHLTSIPITSQTIQAQSNSREIGICPICGKEGFLFSDCAECGDFILTRK